MEKFRIGFGFDSHRFDTTRELRLGGVSIPDSPGLHGHSDADVLLHAVMDALLGAAALGDIGAFFPDDDPQWKDADSADLLARVVEEVASAGWRISNIDATVICERPKLRPHIPAIRERIAALSGCPIEAVSVKGKTNEGMDSIGQGAGMAVHCVVMLTAMA